MAVRLSQMNFPPYFAGPIQLHSHFTRKYDQLRLPPAKTTKYQGSFRINGGRDYNSLPSNIRAVKDFKKLKSIAKRYFKT